MAWSMRHEMRSASIFYFVVVIYETYLSLAQGQKHAAQNVIC